MIGTLDVRTVIPIDQYRALNTIAEQNHTTVSVVIAEVVRRSLRGEAITVMPATTNRKLRRRATPDDLNTLVRMWENKATDGDIATTLGMSRTWVTHKRRALHLASNGYNRKGRQ